MRISAFFCRLLIPRDFNRFWFFGVAFFIQYFNARSAQKRHESRGLHFTLDYPRQSKRPRQTVIEGYRG